MKLLNWLIGDPKHVELRPDALWKTPAAKFAGIKKLVTEGFLTEDAPLAVILVAHFPETLAELEKIAQADGIAGPVTATLAGGVNYVSTSAAMFGESDRIEIIVAERHPLRSHDDEVIEFAQGLPCPSRLRYHLSLEDGLMKPVANEWVQMLLDRLGMKEDESIEVDVISQRIKREQMQIADRVINDEPADSADEWMAKYLSS